MVAEMIASRIADSWTVEVVRPGPADRVLGLRYEVRLCRPDGTYIVASRDDSLVGVMEDMEAAAFAIAAVLDPEHNGPWEEA